MMLEVHILQNFAPSNLNRDDTGSSKTCEFGGYRRARISSQSIKRSIRKSESFQDEIGRSGGVRTRRLIAEVASRLTDDRASSQDLLSIVAEIFRAGGIERASRRDDEENSSILLFIREAAIDDIVSRFREVLDELRAKSEPARSSLVVKLGDQLEASAHCPDVALFGRMIEIADSTPFGKRNLRVDAAAQVAHAISTHQVSAEFDYYTAVDDLLQDNETGAGMIGTVEFNSACYYRYSNIDLRQLRDNLQADDDLVSATIRAYLLASRDAIPTGKQHSFAAQNAPSFIMTVVRDHGAWSLANAFARPVRPTPAIGLVDVSIASLDQHWGDLVSMYGEPPGAHVAVCALGSPSLTHLTTYRLETFGELLERTLSGIGAAAT